MFFFTHNSDDFVSCTLCWCDRGGIFASGAADDTIQLFVDNNESQVWRLFILSWLLHKCIYPMPLAVQNSNALLLSLLM